MRNHLVLSYFGLSRVLLCRRQPVFRMSWLPWPKLRMKEQNGLRHGRRKPKGHLNQPRKHSFPISPQNNGMLRFLAWNTFFKSSIPSKNSFHSKGVNPKEFLEQPDSFWNSGFDLVFRSKNPTEFLPFHLQVFQKHQWSKKLLEKEPWGYWEIWLYIW